MIQACFNPDIAVNGCVFTKHIHEKLNKWKDSNSVADSHILNCINEKTIVMLNSVTFSVKTGQDGNTNGTLKAVNSTGNAFESGTKIRNGSSVTLTATPKEGYVVDQWLVNNKIYHWSGTEEAYRGTTLTLEDIQSAQNIVVSFKEMTGTYTITAGVVDESGKEDASLATISAVNAETEDVVKLPVNAEEGTSITFKATVTNDSVNMVKEWQISTDQGATFRTAKGSGGSDTFTLYNVGSDTVVRAVVTKSQTYTLNYQVKIGDTAVSDNSIASLTAASNGQSLASGSTLSAYIPVEFDLTLNDNYYLVGWSSNVEVDEKDSTKAALESLTSNTGVTVTIAEKPVITFGTYTGGTVTAAMPDPKDETKEITVKNGDHVAPGSDVTFTFAPKTGYGVNPKAKANGEEKDTVFADGNGETTDVRTCMISNIRADQNVEAVFTALKQYSVKYEVVETIVDQVDGSLSASAGRKNLDAYIIEDLDSGDSVCAGADLTFTAVPKSGYKVKQWKVNGQVQTKAGLTVTENTLCVSPVENDVTVTVEFIQSGDKLTIQADENGKIVSAIAGGKDQIENINSGFTLGENASVTITASANTGYEVENWTVNGKIVEKDGKPITDLVYTYKSDGTKAGADIIVHFRQIPYSVSWSGADGTVKVQGYEGSSAQIRGGSQVTFKVTPDEGQMMDYWTVNGVKVQGETSETFTWTVPNGATATPAVSTYKIQAICKEAPFEVIYTQPTANGSLSAKAGSKAVSTGDTVEGNTVVTFTAKPNSGYMVGKWTVNGETIDSQKNTLDVTVKKDTEVSVTIIPDTYTVTAVADGTGTISVGTDSTGSYQAKYGTSLTFTAKAGNYWEIGDWYVDGEKVTEGVSSDHSTFTLTDIKNNQTVKVEFVKAVYYEVSYSVEGDSDNKHGSLEAKADDQTLNLAEGADTNVRGGAELSFTAKPDVGYMVDKWFINGKEVNNNITTHLSIKELSTNVNVKVLYKAYTGFDIPKNGNGYLVKDVERTPDDTEKPEQIRLNGDLTFTVKLDEENGFNTLSKLVVNGYDCIAGELVEENQPVTGCETLDVVKNEDGSYTITLKNVKDKIVMDAEAHIFRKEDAVFTWSENNTKATVTITCADENCTDSYTLDCEVDMKRGDGKLTFTASADYYGTTYTQTVTTDHLLTQIPAKEATCVEAGNIEHWVCDDENCPDGIRKFADEKGNQVLIDGQEIIPVDKVNGHDYAQSNVIFQWGKKGSATAYVICSRCGEKKAVKCTVKKKEGIGKMTYTATAIWNNKTYTDKKTVKYTNAWAKTVLRPQGTASKTSIKIKWNAVPGADGYVIYWNKCGSKKAFKQVKVIKSGKTLTWTHKGLKAGSDNRYYVKAYKIIDGKRYFIKKSSQIHLETKGGKYTNVKKLKSDVSSVTLKKGSKKTLKITQIYVEKNKKPTSHMRPLVYTSSNSKVATVTSKGVIKARGKGTCYIYVTAFSGAYKRIKVVVK